MELTREVAKVSARQQQREAHFVDELAALAEMVRRIRSDYNEHGMVDVTAVEKMAAWATGVGVRAGQVVELRILVEDLARSQS